MTMVRAWYFLIHELLPKSVGDRLLAFWAHSYIRRTLRKRRTAKRKALKLDTLAAYGKFGADELTRALRDLGIEEGDLLFVQCSFNDLYTFESSPMELIRALESAIGSSGTLFFPAYTNRESTPSKPFNPLLDPTYTGIVSEIFRRSAGVVRSLHPRHSICGRGPLAEELLAGHELCSRADGLNSPLDRMRFLSNAKILTLGLPLGHISFLHWVEDFEPDKLPFAVCRAEAVDSSIEMPDGSVISIRDWQVRSDIAARLSLAPLFTQLSGNACNFTQYKGVSIGIYPMIPLAKELLALRDRGMIHYN